MAAIGRGAVALCGSRQVAVGTRPTRSVCTCGRSPLTLFFALVGQRGKSRGATFELFETEVNAMSNGATNDRVVSAGRVPGRDRINTARELEVRYWTARLGCSAEELRAAIRVVGNSIARVRAYVDYG